MWPTYLGEFYNPEHNAIKNDLINYFDEYMKKNPHSSKTRGSENYKHFESEHNLHSENNKHFNNARTLYHTPLLLDTPCLYRPLFDLITNYEVL